MAERNRNPSLAGRAGRLLMPGLAAAGVLLLLADLFVHKHGPFAVEHVFGFYAAAGFAGAGLLILAALVVRHLFWRPEDYYRD